MDDKGFSERASEEFILLFLHVSEQQPGTELLYADVEKATGVPLPPGSPNRDRLRQAIIKTGQTYFLLRNEGYKLADADSAEAISAHSLLSASAANDRALETHRRLEPFVGEMSRDKAERLRFNQSTLAAVKHALDIEKKRSRDNKQPVRFVNDGSVPA